MTEDTLWRVDAWDARAGLAFASYRPADDRSVDHVALDVPTVFISPPTFRPEQLESRAVAFGASRSSFQQGLFARGREVGFQELGQLIETVRRSYVAGSATDHGNDGGGGNTEAPPDRPPDAPAAGEGDFLPGDGKGAGIRREIEQEISRFSETVTNLSSQRMNAAGEPAARDFHWSAQLESANLGADDLLHRGCLRIVLELLARHDSSAKVPGYFQWAQAASGFARASAILDVWPPRTGAGYLGLMISFRSVVDELQSTPAIAEMYRRLRKGHEDASRWVMTWLFMPETRKTSSRHWPYDYDPLVWAGEQINSAPLRELARWPIPKALGALISPEYPERCSVADLLALFLASPQTFSEGKQHLPAALEICLFAAAFLTHRDSAISVTMDKDEQAFWRPRNHRHNGGAMHLHKAWRWMSKQLPSVAFTSTIEKMIFAVSRLRYYRSEEERSSPASPRVRTIRRLRT